MLTDGSTPEEGAIVSQHFNYLKGLMEQGVVILAGRTLNTDDSSFGIIVFNAASDDDAQQIVDGDPAVRQGVMRATLFPYRVALIQQANVEDD